MTSKWRKNPSIKFISKGDSFVCCWFWMKRENEIFHRGDEGGCCRRRHSCFFFFSSSRSLTLSLVSLSFVTTVASNLFYSILFILLLACRSIVGCGAVSFRTFSFSFHFQWSIELQVKLTRWKLNEETELASWKMSLLTKINWWKKIY